LIEELLRHLLWNCILFGNSGGEARASVKPKRFGATVYVSDDGVGVPPHEQEKVFDPFYQVQEYLSRNREGLGLGLTLARRIARMHKGDVVLKSDGKSGTTAVIELADLMR
jgi:signal transduction histidine kinase